MTTLNASVPCFLRGAAPLAASVPLAVAGDSSGSPAADLDLAIRGGGPRLARGLPLAVANTPPTADFVTLAIAAPGMFAGAVPAAAPLHLLVGKDTGRRAGITLVLCNTTTAARMTLAVAGIGVAAANTPLSVAGAGGSPSASLTLALPVAVDWTPLASSVTLALPAAVGAAHAPVTLVVRGWWGTAGPPAAWHGDAALTHTFIAAAAGSTTGVATFVPPAPIPGTATFDSTTFGGR